MIKNFLSVIAISILLIGCGEEDMPPFNELSEQQIISLKSGEKVCYSIARSINLLFPQKPTHCTAIEEKEGGMFKENYSFHLRTSTKETAEWHKWSCLAAGKVMSEGVNVGMDKIYLKSKPSNDYSLRINAHFCRDIHRKAIAKGMTESEVLKAFNRFSANERI